MFINLQLSVSEIEGLASFQGKAAYDYDWSNQSNCDGTTFAFIESKLVEGADYIATTFEHDQRFLNDYRKPKFVDRDAVALLKLSPSSKPLFVFLFSIQKFSQWLLMAKDCKGIQRFKRIDVSLSSLGFSGQNRPKYAWKTCSFDDFLNGSPFQFDEIDGQVINV